MEVNQEKIKNLITEIKPATIVAATKYGDYHLLNQLENCGITFFGENRVQALLEKYEKYHGKGEFHMIGTLQKNKVKYIIDKVKMIHAVDSLSLLEVIDKQAKKHQITMPILLQVNIALEESKHGFKKQEVEEICKLSGHYPNVEIQGLMMMAPNKKDVEVYFEQTKALFEELKKQFPQLNLKHLSMGMSNDYQYAIKHGATLVRLGSILLEGATNERN